MAMSLSAATTTNTSIVSVDSNGVITITPVFAGTPEVIKPDHPIGIDPVPNPVDPDPVIVKPLPGEKPELIGDKPIPPKYPCDPKVPGDCPVTTPVEPGNPVGVDPVPNPVDPKPDPVIVKPLPGEKPEPEKPVENPGIDPIICDQCPIINLYGLKIGR